MAVDRTPAIGVEADARAIGSFLSIAQLAWSQHVLTHERRKAAAEQCPIPALQILRRREQGTMAINALHRHRVLESIGAASISNRAVCNYRAVIVAPAGGAHAERREYVSLTELVRRHAAHALEDYGEQAIVAVRVLVSLARLEVERVLRGDQLQQVIEHIYRAVVAWITSQCRQ